MVKASKIVSLLIMLSLVVLAIPFQPAEVLGNGGPPDVWVAPPPLGNNGNTGTQAQPFATIQWGIDHAAPDGTVHVAAGTYYENLTISAATNLIGAGAQTTIIDGRKLGTVISIIAISIPASIPNEITGFTIQNGIASTGGGGGIYNTHILSLSNCTIKDNQAEYGGGICSESLLLMYGCTVSGNTAYEAGGGILSGGIVTLPFACTVSSNRVLSTESGAGGAGIYHHGFIMYLIDCTVANNTAAGSGSFGGGFYNGGFIASFFNTIVANNGAGTGNNGYNSGQQPISLGYNLDSENSCGFNQPTDLVNTNPLLGPLQDNGGPTFTHALLRGSPAIDSSECFPVASAGTQFVQDTQQLLNEVDSSIVMGGDNKVMGMSVSEFVGMTVNQSMMDMNTDQRGVPRPQGSACDVGAYELAQASVDTATGTGTAYFSTLNGYITDLTALDEGELDCPPNEALDFPHGLFSFTITGITPGSTVTIVIILPSDVPTDTQYWKCIDGQWVDCTSLLSSNDGDSVLMLNITDGGLGDRDGVANGTIVDPGGPVLVIVLRIGPSLPSGPRGAPRNPANLSIQYMSINPKQVYANQTVTITTNVANTGGETGSLNVILKINDKVEQTKAVIVGPQGTQPVKFTVTETQAGTYNVDIGGQKGSFTVLGAGGSAADSSSSDRMIAIIIVIAVLVVAVILLVWMLIRRSA